MSPKRGWGRVLNGCKLGLGGPIHEMCANVGCPKIHDIGGQLVCGVYPSPEYWWNKGRCPIPPISVEMEKTFKINPLKAAKIKMKGSLRLGYKLKKAPYDKGRFDDGKKR